MAMQWNCTGEQTGEIPGKENGAGSWLQCQELVLELLLQILGEISSLI